MLKFSILSQNSIAIFLGIPTMQRAQFVAAIILSFSLLFLATVSAHARPINRHVGPGEYLPPLQLEARDSKHQIASQDAPLNPVGGSANSVAGSPALSARDSVEAAGNKNLHRIRTGASGTPSESNTTATGFPAAYGQQSNNPATGNYPSDPSVIVHNQGLRRRNHGFNKEMQVQSDTTATGTRNYQPVDQRIPHHGKTYRITKASDINIDQQASVNANGGQPKIMVTATGNNQANVNGNNQHPLENANGGQPNTIATKAGNYQHTLVNANRNNPQSLVNANEGQLNNNAARTESSQSSGGIVSGGQLNNIETPVEKSRTLSGKGIQLRSGNVLGIQSNNNTGDTSNSQSGGNISEGQLNNSEIEAGNPRPTRGSTFGGQPNNNAAGTKTPSGENTSGGQLNGSESEAGNSQPTSGSTSGGQPNKNAENSQLGGNTSGGQLDDSETGAGNSQPTSGSASGGQPNKIAAGTKNSQSGSENTSGGQLNNSETGAGNSQPTSGSASGGQPNNNAAGTKNSQSSGENNSATRAENSQLTSGNTFEGQPNNNRTGAGSSEPSGGNTSKGQLNNSETGSGISPPTSGSTSGVQPEKNAVGTGNSQPSGGNTSEDHSNHTTTDTGKFQQASVDERGIGSLLPHSRNSFHDHADDSNDEDESSVVQEFLEAHNVIRKIFHQPLYKWDKKLAQLANQYATERYNDCAMIHSPWEYGENLAYGGSPKWTALNAVKAWFNESQFYDFKTNTCLGENPNRKCGHFTQMVWRDTVSLGCARQPCFRNGREGVIIVCEYFPPGNYPDENPFETHIQSKKK